MSTHATVEIDIEGVPALVLYVHCDGYPEGLGIELWKILVSCGVSHVEKFVKRLLESDYDPCLCDINCNQIDISDIDWTYQLNFFDCAHMMDDSMGFYVGKPSYSKEKWVFEGAGDPWDVCEEYQKWVKDNK